MGKGRKSKRYVESDDESQSTDDDFDCCSKTASDEERAFKFETSSDDFEDDENDEEDNKEVVYEEENEGDNDGVGKIIRDNARCDYSSSATNPQADRILDAALSELHTFRTVDPLFLEDHDFLYRLVAFGSNATLGGISDAQVLVWSIQLQRAKSLMGNSLKKIPPSNFILRIYQKPKTSLLTSQKITSHVLFASISCLNPLLCPVVTLAV